MSETAYASEELERFARGIVHALGAPDDIAQEVARHLVRANLSGQDSHGVFRLPMYAGLVERGELLPPMRPEVIKESGNTVLVDARRGFTHYAARFALDLVAAKAQQGGIGAAAIRHATHVGRLGEYTERCSDLGLVLLMTVGMAGPGVGGVVPFGGRERFFGANVWSIGVPGERDAMVFDASMASVAVGKVLVAKAAGESLPAGCLVDREGRPSTDPGDYAPGGAVVPLGGQVAGHKGFGLGLAAALLGGLAMIDDDAPTLAGAPVAAGASAQGRMAGVFLVAIDPEAFGGLAPFRALVDDCLGALRDVAPAPGSDGVSVPGERSQRSRSRRGRNGIALADATRDELAALGARLGVPMPSPIDVAQVLQ